jgi:hypothetical protein
MPVDRLRGQLLVHEGEASEAAVSDDLERDALVDRARGPRIDQQREVRVAVDVDESGRDDLARRVELAPRVRDDADRDDAPSIDADVGAPLPGSRAVHDDPAADREVDHDAFRVLRSSAVAVASSSPSTTTTP